MMLKLTRWWHGLHMEYVSKYEENYRWVYLFRCDHGHWKKATLNEKGEECVLEWGLVE